MIRRGSPGREALQRILTDRLAVMSLLAIVAYVFVALASACGWFHADFDTKVGEMYMPPSGTHWFGTDLLGRDVFAKLIHGAQVAFSIGFVASCIAIPIGACLGTIAGFFGGKTDEAVVWLYTTVASVPSILLLTSLNFVFGKGLLSMYVAVGLTSWVGICRLIRGEVLKLKRKEFVLAARTLGAKNERLLAQHILPNLTHLLIIDFSLRFVYAIKSEAILSYLGLGVSAASWGNMIADAKEELVQGIWWELTAATSAMFLLVLAFNILGDSLRDALDPRLSS